MLNGSMLFTISHCNAPLDVVIEVKVLVSVQPYMKHFLSVSALSPGQSPFLTLLFHQLLLHPSVKTLNRVL